MVAPLIPPSIGLVRYALLAPQSVERMILAGLVPGVLLGISLMAFNRYLASRENFPPQPRASRQVVVGHAPDGLLALVAPAIILGTILIGFVTATEAGVLACLYSILLGMIYRTLTFERFWAALTMLMTTVIMIIIGCSIAMGWRLAIEQVLQMLGDALFSITENKQVFLALMPVIDAYGVDRVHFGIMLQLGLLISIVTPPMSIGRYVMVEVGKVPFEKVTVACLPFMVPLILIWIALTFVPELSLWLPNLVLGPD